MDNKENKYTVYFNKNRAEIKVKMITNGMVNCDLSGANLSQYNNCYYVCKNRKIAIETARKIKREWIISLNQQILTLLEINI